MVSGNIYYCVATPTLIYAIVNDEALFDALPGVETLYPKVRVKDGFMGDAQVVYQYFLAPLERSVDEYKTD